MDLDLEGDDLKSDDTRHGDGLPPAASDVSVEFAVVVIQEKHACVKTLP